MLRSPTLGNVANAERRISEIGHDGVGSGSALQLFQREVKIEGVEVQLASTEVADGGADDRADDAFRHGDTFLIFVNFMLSITKLVGMKNPGMGCRG